METEAIKKVSDYTLVFNGLFGRNRKVKFTTVRVVRVPEGTTPEASPEALVEEGLNKIGAKKGKWTLVVRPVEVKGNMESYMLFSDVTIAKGEV